MSDIRLIVMNNGLQLIGSYESKDTDKGVIVVSKPVQVIIMPNSDPAVKPGQMGMGFAPFLQYTEEWSTGIRLVVSDVLTVSTPIRELVNSYNTTFGSGLVLPPGVGKL